MTFHNIFCSICSNALFDKDGNQVPQQIVIKVGEIFERILKEVVFNDSLTVFNLLYQYWLVYNGISMIVIF